MGSACTFYKKKIGKQIYGFEFVGLWICPLTKDYQTLKLKNQLLHLIKFYRALLFHILVISHIC